MTTSLKLELFFSYAHGDQQLRDRLEKHLSSLKNEGVIGTWHDGKLVAGQELDAGIMERLKTADIILLLVSPDFMSSYYCYEKEMAIALERHQNGTAKVIPVILRPIDWEGSPLGKLLGNLCTSASFRV
jgi:hypothetical protein